MNVLYYLYCRAELARKFFIGVIASTLGCCFSIPFDVAKSRIQGPQPEPGKVKYKGLFREDSYLDLLHQFSMKKMIWRS